MAASVKTLLTVLALVNASVIASAAGNLKCSSRTTGTCAVLSCKAARGPTVCAHEGSGLYTHKICECKPGYCADENSYACVESSKWEAEQQKSGAAKAKADAEAAAAAAKDKAEAAAEAKADAEAAAAEAKKKAAAAAAANKAAGETAAQKAAREAAERRQAANNAHHFSDGNCCSCCTHGQNTCSLSGKPGLCKQTTGVLALCNQAAYQHPTLFFPGCYRYGGELLAEGNTKPEQSMKQPDWFSKPMSHTEGLLMMFFVSSGLAMGLGYMKSRRIVIDSTPLLA